MTTLYTTGTAKVTNGSVNVTGAGTAWHSNTLIQPGLTFAAGGQNYQIQSVSSTTETLTLTTPWSGATNISPGISYSIEISPETLLDQITVIPSQIEGVTGQAILATGRDTIADGGGGILIYNPTSTATPNGSTVFGTPAITGRFIRPVDGVIHSKWFGLKHDPTGALDQSVALQTFFYALADPVTNQVGQVRGYLSPGTYYAAPPTQAPKTLYLTRRGDAGLFNGTLSLSGGSHRSSIIRNCTLAIGSVPWRTLVSSQIKFKNIRVEGAVDIWNCEGNSRFDELTIARAPPVGTTPPTDYFFYNRIDAYSLPDAGSSTPALIDRGAWSPNTSYVPADMITIDDATASPAKGGTYVCLYLHGHTSSATFSPDIGNWLRLSDYNGWLGNVYNANHPLFINLSLEGHGTHSDTATDTAYRNGLCVRSTLNPHFIQGTVFGCSPIALQFNDGGTQRYFIDGMKFEQCEGTHIWDRSSGNGTIMGVFRQGANHTTTLAAPVPLIRLGEAGVATPKRVTIRASQFLNDLPSSGAMWVGTAIKLEQCQDVLIDENSFSDTKPFNVHIDPGAGIAVTGFKMGDTNYFGTGGMQVARVLGTELKRPHADIVKPLTLVDAVDITWNVKNGLHAQVICNDNRNIRNPTNIREGETYTLTLRSQTIPRTYTFNDTNGTVFRFSGTPPDFSTMTVTQMAILVCRCRVNPVTGSNQPPLILATDYLVYGT